MGDSEIDTDELSNSEEFISDQSLETPKKKRYRRRIYFDSLPRKKVKTKTSVDVTTHVGIDHHVDSGTDSDVSPLSNTTEISSDNDCESNISFSEYMLSEEIDSEEDHSRYECDSGDKETRHQNSSTGKLFESSILSKIVSSVLIISFVRKYGLGKEAFKDLLTLISLHLPQTNNGVSTIHKLNKLLGNYLNIPEPRSCYFCSKCQRLLKNEQICQLCVNSSVLEFADLDFKRQLSDLLKDDNFRKELKPRNANNTGDALSDITDGSEYKRLTEEFKSKSQSSTQDTLHLTFTLNTDGVALFSSTKKGSLWPIYLAVNELPVKLRFTKKYLIPCYLFCQIEKPNMISYLQPLVTTLKSLHFQGFSIPTNSGVLKVFGHLLAATLDLPAKAMVANMKQFNGKSACSVCLDTGVARPNLPMLRYYPFDEESELRSQDSWLRHAQDSTQSPDAVCGIKGTSALASLTYVDLPKLFVIDWMHCVLLGVVKALMKCWFVGPRGNEYYIGDKISFLNRKLQAIKVPDFVARTPRTLTGKVFYFNSSECREWLFHFSIPLLSSVMKPLHLSHYALLVTAMVILNQETLEMGQLMHAEEMKLDFCRIFPEIYGNVKQTMNMHLLRHLPHFVRLHGPLFTTSCFGFESMNSHLKKMVHGTRHVTKQVSFAVNIAKSLPGLVEYLTKDSEMNTKVKDYLQSLTGHSDRLDETAMEDVILGKKKWFQPDDSFLDFFNLRTKTLFHKFFRLQTQKGVFYSQQYDRVKCRNSYSVLLDNQMFGTIEYFLEADAELFVVINVIRKSLETFIKFDQNCQHHSILKKYMNQQALLCHHITPVSLNTKRQLFPVSHLRCKCIYMSDDSKENIAYMSVPPNLVEHS